MLWNLCLVLWLGSSLALTLLSLPEDTDDIHGPSLWLICWAWDQIGQSHHACSYVIECRVSQCGPTYALSSVHCKVIVDYLSEVCHRWLVVTGSCRKIVEYVQNASGWGWFLLIHIHIIHIIHIIHTHECVICATGFSGKPPNLAVDMSSSDRSRHTCVMCSQGFWSFLQQGWMRCRIWHFVDSDGHPD